jgi:hypothetical protein
LTRILAASLSREHAHSTLPHLRNKHIYFCNKHIRATKISAQQFLLRDKHICATNEFICATRK